MGQRGPKPLPVNVHLLRGNASKKPVGQLLDDIVRPEIEVPPCPKHMGTEARAEWKRITRHLVKLGLITQIDRAALTGYCDSWGEYVWAMNRIKVMNAEDVTGERGRIGDTPSGYKQISVVKQIANRALDSLAKYLAEFGMSPAARSRVTASDPQLGLPGLDKPEEGGWAAFK
jgi:P27 family predicted phage terminase small subunit